MIEAFESSMCGFTGSKNAVAVSNGTAALHSAVYAAGIAPGDEVITSPMTFVATANAVVFQGGKPVFADVKPGTLLIDPARVREKITPRTRAIIAIDYAGQPCDYDALARICRDSGLLLIADAAHSLGASYKGRKVGTLADLTTFSFHPVKLITTGEGGMVVTGDHKRAERMRRFRNHGIATDFKARERVGTWYYEMLDLGYNYRITDFQCALGISQLKKLPSWLHRRREIARQYDDALSSFNLVEPLETAKSVEHAYHLYVVRLDLRRLTADRARVFSDLRARGIGVNVHYIPVHLHPFYRERFGTKPGSCPVAEEAYEKILTIPLFPGLDEEDVTHVIDTLKATLRRYEK